VDNAANFDHLDFTHHYSAVFGKPIRRIMKKDTMQQIAPTATMLLLNRYLSDIFDMGDRDEMSWKHIGHGCASLLATDNWRECLDYRRPDERLTPEQYTKLDALWYLVADIMKKQGKQWFINSLYVLQDHNPKLLYSATYLGTSWMGYRDLIEKQNLIVRKEN
jgi:hypothetical protein